MSMFELNLARVLAHSAVFFSKELHSPGGIVDDARCEDGDAPDAPESTAEAMSAYVKFLPLLLNKQREAMPKMEKARVETMEQFSPRLADLQTRLFEQNAPRLAEVSQGIDAGNKLAGSNADLAVLQGPGRDSFRAVTEMLEESDPEFFALRGQTADQLSQLMTGELTGSEEEAINRRLARDRVNSGISTPTSSNTVSEAMQFGDAARKRQLEGVSAATSFLPSSRTGFDPTGVALGRPSINTGESQFMGVTQPASPENSANNFFNQIAGFQTTGMNIDAQKRDWIDRVNEGVGSVNL